MASLGELLMVGSVPFDTAEEVFRACGRHVGDYISSVPDGEFGPRTSWIGYLARDVYDGHPEIDTLSKLDESKPTSLKDQSNKWVFKLKKQPKPPRLVTGYAKIALDSYRVLQRVRAAGEIRNDVRFQVCFPSTYSAFISYFDDPADWPSMASAYEDAVRRDIAEILSVVPADDLVIQFDVCVELRDMQNALPWSPPRETKFDETISAVTRLSSNVPEGALLGLHWCYGTLGGWPMVRIEDLDLCTRLTNAAAAGIARRVDYVHMPVLRQAGDRYFEPVRDLNASGTKVYLGLIHHSDGIEGFKDRLAIARRYINGDFGVASVCGYGRLSAAETRTAFEVHRQAGEALHGLREKPAVVPKREPAANGIGERIP